MTHEAELAGLLSRNGFRRFALSRTPVGHVTLGGRIENRPMTFVLDTGAAKTFVELTYCRAENIAVTDTGMPGQSGNVYGLGDLRLTLDGMLIRTDGIFAIDMSRTNERLQRRGVEPIRAVIGQDVLRNHSAIIDYAALVLYLKGTNEHYAREASS